MRNLPLLGALVALSCADGAAGDIPLRWRKVLGFDLCGEDRPHRADLGQHTFVEAHIGECGWWTLGVEAYGATKPVNLLYDGNNWHGMQPWDICPNGLQTSRETRIVTYGRGQRKLRIELSGLETNQVASNKAAFVKGRIDVFHFP